MSALGGAEALIEESVGPRLRAWVEQGSLILYTHPRELEELEWMLGGSGIAEAHQVEVLVEGEGFRARVPLPVVLARVKRSERLRLMLGGIPREELERARLLVAVERGGKLTFVLWYPAGEEDAYAAVRRYVATLSRRFLEPLLGAVGGPARAG